MSALPPAQAAAPEYVGFWARVGAALIDTLWTLPFLLPLLVVLLGGWQSLTLARLEQGSASLPDQLLLYAALGVLVLPFWLRRHATPGKMAIGAEIVDARTLGPPSSRQLVLRFLGYLISSLPLYLGLVWVAFDPRKQGWHDKLARTVVIYVRPGRPPL